MDTLSTLVQSLNKEEIRSFKLYTQRYATGANALGSRLLDLMRRNAENTDENEIFIKLYGAKGDKNTFYRLKNRLQEDICDALTLLHFDKHETNSLHRAICVYNILLDKGRHELAYYFIKKAEKRAQQTENYELLDLIYANIVKLSNDVIAINPEEYIDKQSENALVLNRVRQMDQILAALNYRIKLSQNFQKQNESLLKLVDKTVKDFAKDKAISQSRSFQIKIYRAISQAMIQKHNFKALEPFLLKTLAIFDKNNWFDKNTHDVKLQMLVYIINALFMNRKLEGSLEYTKLLGTEISQYDKLYYEKYLFFYYNSLVINYAQTNVSQALAVLDEFERVNKKDQNSYYQQFIHLNRATLYFDAGRYSDAVRSLTKLYVNEHYKSADRNFKLKIEIAEVIMQYESKDNDTVSRRIRQIKKAYKDLLKDQLFIIDKSVLDILDILAKEDNKIDAKLIKKIRAVIDEVAKSKEGTTHVINYSSWLAPKVGFDLRSIHNR